jgi:hypothetical protein
MKKSRKHSKSHSRANGDDREAPLNSTSPNQLSAPNAARRYLERGFAPIPLPSKSKAPSVKAWPEFRVTAAEVRSHFTKGGNVGLLLGAASGWLVDVDIDADEASLHAARFFPKTALVSGRDSRPNSHLWFRSKLPRTVQFQHQGKMILELRSTGSQTLVPPSRHPEGEHIRWSEYGEPTEIAPDDLRARAAAFASAILIGQSWPKKGQRNAAALAVAGFLLQRSIAPERVRRILLTAAQVAGDEEASSRGRVVESTREKIQRGEQVTAETAARSLLGDAVVTSIERWISEAAESGESPGGGAAGGHTRSSAADKIIELASDFRFFRATSDGGQVFASIEVDGRRETWRLDSASIRGLLAYRFHTTHRQTPAKSAIDDAIGVLAGMAVHNRVYEPIALRVAEHAGVLYIDLCDENRRVVAVTARGWSISKSCPINFVRSGSMMSLPTPKRGGKLDELRRFVNLESVRDWRLLVSWLISTFHPTGPYVVLSVSGAQGSAKSTLCETLKSLSDPDQANIRTAPENLRDLAIEACGNHVLAFDNMSILPPKLSDGFCRLSTGAAFSVRKLFTDSEQTLFKATRPVIVNGIPDLVGQPDLLDRAIHLIVPKIRDRHRKDLQTFRADFEVTRPRIFGAILDALSGVLRNLPKVAIERLPRMADFARWSVALEMHLGLPPGSFVKCYAANRQASSLIALDESPLVRPIRYFLKVNGGRFEGPASELLRGLNRLSFGWIEQLRRSPDWPRRPNRLSGDLQRLGPSLEQAGIKFDRGRQSTDSKRSRFIILRRFKRRPTTKHVAQLFVDEAPPRVVRGRRSSKRRQVSRVPSSNAGAEKHRPKPSAEKRARRRRSS